MQNRTCTCLYKHWTCRLRRKKSIRKDRAIKVKTYAEYQENFLTVQSLRQVFLPRLQTKEDSVEEPRLFREGAPSSPDFTLQKANRFNVQPYHHSTSSH